MQDYERGNCSPISKHKHKHYEFYSTKEIVEIKKIIKFYRILFGLQITIIILIYYIYYIYNLCV